MTWQPEIDELNERKRLASLMGGAEKVARHHANGKLTVRERVDQLLDAGSFREIGSIAGKASYDESGSLTAFTPANMVTGRGCIDDRPVVIAGDDFTVRGGANDGAVKEKLVTVEMMARDLRLPLVRLVDGTGGGGSVKSIEIAGHTHLPTLAFWNICVENLSLVPVVGLALGSVAGLGSARVAASHYSLIVKDTAQMFVAGPPVVARTGEVLEKNELGGSEIHAKNGAVDDEVDSEAEAFARTRKFLSYLPNSVFELPPRIASGDDPARREEWLIDAIPRDARKVYKMRPIVDALFDRDSFFEIGRKWGRPVITGFARLDGWPVAVLASDPYHYGGGWSADAADKVTRFADLAQTFHLPVVNLVDVPGFLVGLDAEKAGTIRHGVRAMQAVYQATVPWCVIILRKAYGVAGAAHMNPSRYNMRYAWPSGDWGSLPIAGGLEAAYKSELEAAADPAAKLAEIEARLAKLASPFRSAESFNIEEIIDPRDTRKLLCEFAELAAPLRTAGRSTNGYRP
jgi:acetyl-CoA carboxylase carboxyltransferase component